MLMQVDPTIELLRRKMRRTSVLMELITNLHCDIAEQVEEFTKTNRQVPVQPGDEPESQKLYEAIDLQVWESPGGRFTFSFDLQRPFYLPRRLAKALLYLATAPAAEPSPAQGLVGYRTRSDIHIHLQKTAKPGKIILRRYVNNITSRLREAILENTKRDLIQSENEWDGVALLLKSGGLHGLEKTSAHKWL